MTTQQIRDVAASATRSARRATVGKSVLGWAAMTCLVINGAWWGMVMLDLLAPRRAVSTQSLQALLLVVAFAIILPLFWSMLLPSSPAGRLLQKQQWATPGYFATAVAALFLTFNAALWVRSWWAAQPGVVEIRQEIVLTVTSLIAGVLVPALCWCVTTPEQWVAAIEQARSVRRLEHAMQLEEAAMRATYARAVSLLHAELSNRTLAENRELATILGTFARMSQHSLAAVAATFNDMYGVECSLSTMPDRELLDRYKDVAQLLSEGADAQQTTSTYAAQLSAPMPPASHQERPTAVETSAQHGPAWSAKPPGVRACAVAHEHLSGAWKRQQLQDVLQISKTQALDYISYWVSQGDVERLTEPADHYAWRDE